jgi:hypothetical protein
MTMGHSKVACGALTYFTPKWPTPLSGPPHQPNRSINALLLNSNILNYIAIYIIELLVL